jgi:hypothetical protein
MSGRGRDLGRREILYDMHSEYAGRTCKAYQISPHPLALFPFRSFEMT